MSRSHWATGIPNPFLRRSTMEGGKSERVQKLLGTFGIDEAAVGQQEFRKMYDDEGPIWIGLVKSLGLTPE